MERAWSLCNNFIPDFDAKNPNAKRKSELVGFSSLDIPDALVKLAEQLRETFAKFGIFVSKLDLENDLYSAMPDVLAAHYDYESEDSEEIIKEMKAAKAEGMFTFIRQNKVSLKELTHHALAFPLLWLKNMMES